MKTDDEIYKECHEVWIKKTGWGWTFEEFERLWGWLEPNQEFTLKCGEVVCGSMVSYWFNHMRSFEYGWITAYRHYNKEDK